MIVENIETVRRNITETCIKCGRNPEEVTLIAVTKTMDVEKINEAISCGITDIGENKVQEIMEKYDHIERTVKWHLIGHLQTNKVKYIIDKVDLIHSVDRLALAEEIDRRAKKINTVVDVLIQINIAKEETKFGVTPEEADELINAVSKLENIRVQGFMTIAPNFENPELTRPIFRALKQKQLNWLEKGLDMKYLSMGMTNDYRVAIEEGANLIRVGTAIFGKRNYNI